MFFYTAVLSLIFAVIGSGVAAPAAVYNGDGTFYETGLGACGQVNKDTDHIAAVSHQFFDSFEGGNPNPNKNPICGKTATVHYGSKSTKVKIVDRCGGCEGPTDLDLSPTAFSDLANQDLGRIKITWTID